MKGSQTTSSGRSWGMSLCPLCPVHEENRTVTVTGPHHFHIQTHAVSLWHISGTEICFPHSKNHLRCGLSYSQKNFFILCTRQRQEPATPTAVLEPSFSGCSLVSNVSVCLNINPALSSYHSTAHTSMYIPTPSYRHLGNFQVT